MLFYGYIEFSENKATNMIQSYVVSVNINAVINITKNIISYMFIGYELKYFKQHTPVCYFQFYGNQSKIIIEDANLVYCKRRKVGGTKVWRISKAIILVEESLANFIRDHE